jgi:hypothetical protein
MPNKPVISVFEDRAEGVFVCKIVLPLYRYAEIVKRKDLAGVNVPYPKGSDVLKFMTSVVEEMENEVPNA